ncbi:hypothetical protein DH2020_007913 [Rehmannia glutinosa]|uniref:Peptidase A2 domain-containing protein n=1 Tax=Rehmannia glutinosa TaxID=99300 RepID=A0ABR0TZI5_REHGL
MRDIPEQAQSDQYCCFHRDKRHPMKKCFHLKREIEKLIQRGYLKDFVDQRKLRKDPGQYEQDLSPPPHCPEQRPEERYNPNFAGMINVISGEPEAEGAKNALRTHESEHQEVNAGAKPKRILTEPEKNGSTSIVFGAQDYVADTQTNPDAIVISIVMVNFIVKRVLIDMGSDADVIFLGAFRKLQIDSSQISHVSAQLIGFMVQVIKALGEISLPITLGAGAPQKVTKMVKFPAVDAPSTYNAIL